MPRLQVQGKTPEIHSEHLSLADTFRTASDGVYSRDPECSLFREWARLDLENSSLRTGFEFTAIAQSNGRPNGTINQSDYVSSVDPERANGRQLYTVWSRLQTKEVEALRAQSQTGRSAEQAGTLEALLADPWFDGQSFMGTLVGTPKRGTLIGPAGTRSDLRDDPVAEAVRTELENSVYTAESLVTGPRVAVTDFSGSQRLQDTETRQFDLNASQEIPPPAEGYFRFGSIGLRSDVPLDSETISGRRLALQIGETLWQVLRPERSAAAPPDFATHHLLVSGDGVGVWGNRGIVIAYKRARAGKVSGSDDHQEITLREDFAGVVSLAREIDQLLADGRGLLPGSEDPARLGTQDQPEGAQTLITKGEELMQRAAQVRQRLAIPENDLLRAFHDSIGLGQLVETLRDVSRVAGERLQLQRLAEQDKLTKERAATFAKVHSTLGWLGVCIAGIAGVEGSNLIAQYFPLGKAAQNILALVGGPVVLLGAALALMPWKRKAVDPQNELSRPTWLLPVAALVFLLSWLSELLRAWNK